MVQNDFPTEESRMEPLLPQTVHDIRPRRSRGNKGYIPLQNLRPSFSDALKKNTNQSNEEFEEPTAASVPSSRRVSHFGWWWEVASIALAVSCTAAIVAILFDMDRKPLDNWRFDFIQPNSLVAVFSTVAKSALLVPISAGLGQLKWIYFGKHRHKKLSHFDAFDSASRGPWGSIRFLWGLKGKACVATLGAVLVILLLAFEPFAQQVIQYPSKSSLNKFESGSLGRTFAWSDIILDTLTLESESDLDRYDEGKIMPTSA